MIDSLLRLFLGSFLVVALSACAAPKSYVILLPQDGKVSGEVTVSNAKGTEVLNQSWQKTEIAGAEAHPTVPVIVGGKEAQAVDKVLANLPPPPARYVLYFHLDSVELLPASRVLLPEIVKAIQEHRPAQITIIGHTDTVASEGYNLELGRQRAEAVLAYLSSLGAAPLKVETVSKGKKEPQVPTADQIPEPRNRRVEVTVR